MVQIVFNLIQAARKSQWMEHRKAAEWKLKISLDHGGMAFREIPARKK